MGRGRGQLRRLVADFGKLSAEVRTELRPELKRQVEPVQRKVQAKAAVWSTRIPPAVKISQKLAGKRPSVRLIVDKKRAPHAWYYEHDGRQGVFLHPLFGNRRHWYPQQARPFFYGPVDENVDAVAGGVADVVTRAARRHGWH